MPNADYSEAVCKCPHGRMGEKCGVKNVCEKKRNVCRNGGVCKNPTLDAGFECECASGFYGEKCQYEVTEATTEGTTTTTEEQDKYNTIVPVDKIEPDLAEINDLFDQDMNVTPSGKLLIEDDCETPDPNAVKAATTQPEKLIMPDGKLDSLNPVVAVIQNAHPSNVLSTNTKDLSEANDWWDKVLQKVDDNAKKRRNFWQKQT